MSFFSKAEAEAVTVKGKALRRLVCGNGLFVRHKAQLNRAVTTFFKMDWTDPSAECATCANCGYIHWFLILE